MKKRASNNTQARGETRAPAPGKPRPGRAPARVTSPAGGAAEASPRLEGDRRWFATAALGLERVLGAEVSGLPGVSAVEVMTGGVEFSGAFETGMVANLRLRTATRVLLRLGTVSARDFPKLRRLCGALPWHSVVDGRVPLRFEVTARSSRLYHTGAVAETLALAIEEAIGRKVALAAGKEESGEEGEQDGTKVMRIFARGQNDQWTISVDTSGELLHRRGWRTEAGKAPLRETLAAGLLALAGYDPARPLVDLMCGAGTLVIEAAALARGIAPGRGRRFAFHDWPAFEAPRWQRLLTNAGERRVEAAPLWGLDRDPEMVALAARNAARAGVGDVVTLLVAEMGAAARAGEEIALPRGPGLVVVNPPYGHRLGQRGEAARLVRMLGHELRRKFAGWTAGVLLADAAWGRALGMPVRETIALSNGGLRVFFAIVDVPARNR